MSSGSFTWFTLFWTLVAVPIQAAETPIVSMLQSWVMGWFQLAVGAYLIAILLIAAWSSDQSTGQLFFRQLFLAFIVYTIAATAGPFDTWVSGLALGIVNGVTTAMSGVFGAPGVISSQTFDGAANNVLAMGIVVMKHVPKYSFIQGILLGLFVDVYAIVGMLAVGWLFLIYLVSSVFLGFLIAFGPVFVACYFFPFTRKFCDGWVRTVVAALVTQIFVAGLMSIFVLVITQFITQLSANMSGGGGGATGGDIMNEVVNLLVMLAVFVMFVFLGFYLSRLAQSISGGAHAAFARVPSLRNPFRGGDKGGGGGGGNRGGGGSGQAGSGSQAPRQYAFNKSVGGSS
jgi:TrbL/VirB6 plasmid conjugal transfer protein